MRRLILRFLCLHECRFDSLLTACSGGHLLIKTKRYALLLQVENLRNFHHCIESSETYNNGSVIDEKGMAASRVSVELTFHLFYYGLSQGLRLEDGIYSSTLHHI